MSTIAQRSFAAGEIAPSLYARTDQNRYSSALRTCRNFIILKHGGTANRSGTEFIEEVKTSAKETRIIPFIFNADQTYVLEFGDEYIRFYKDGTQITVSGVTAWSGSTAYVVGDLASRLGVNYYCILAHTNQQPPNATYWYPLTGDIFEIPSPYVEGDLFDLNYDQSGDVITITHPSYKVRELRRSGDTSWTLPIVTFAPSLSAPANLASSASGTAVSYKVTAVKRETYEESLPTDAVGSSSETSVLSWDVVAGAVEYNIYKKKQGVFGLIGVSDTSTFTDATITPDETITPPIKRNPFAETPISTVVINAGGTGYAVGDILTITQTGASSGKVLVEKVSAGVITQISIYDEGEGYAVATGLATTGGGGSGATVDITAVRTGTFPSVSNYYQSRHLYGGSDGESETTDGSRAGNFNNFTRSSPLQDDDAIRFNLAGREVNIIRAYIDLGTLIVLTSGAEWNVRGSADGILLAGEPNPKQQSYYGSSKLRPILIGNTVLYVQARGNLVRDLGFRLEVDGYTGNDLTIWSNHLYEQFTIVDWAYSQIPNSIVWLARSDGTLLGITYLRDQELIAHHKHDFQEGSVESVCVVPEGGEDFLYLVINRTINGGTKRYIEKMNTRFIDDIKDAIFMDSVLSFDGTNTAATTMTLSGGTTWKALEELTLTASVSYFVAGDVGNQIHLTGSDGTLIRCDIVSYTNGTVVKVRPQKDVPASLQGVAIATWAKAVDDLSGLDHLEGEDVSVFADGFVVASPNNESYETITVASGAITLDKPYVKIHVGLPYISDLETLDIDTPQGESITSRKKLVSEITAYVEKTRGLFMGAKPPSGTDPLEDLYEVKLRNEELYDDPVELKTGQINVKVKSEWNSNGRVFLRQVDPLPATILAIIPEFMIPVGKRS